MNEKVERGIDAGLGVMAMPEEIWREHADDDVLAVSAS